MSRSLHDSSRPIAPLYGLVLAGGRGSRLGTDKGVLEYHRVPQAEWAYRLLASVCERAFVSIRPDQAGIAPYDRLPEVLDEPGRHGPAAGLAAAFRHAPHAAWLVLAVDLPLVDESLLGLLVAGRDPARDATAFRHRDGVAEPLCAIWEPSARVGLERAGPNASLRRLLEEGDTAWLPSPPEPERLASVNSPEEAERVRARLRDRIGRL